jgi:hypothetical protein
MNEAWVDRGMPGITGLASIHVDETIIISFPSIAIGVNGFISS